MKVHVFDDHDRALSVWRREGVRSLDLVHVDAHSDFAFHRAKPFSQIIASAPSLRALKSQLEYTSAYLRRRRSLDAQTTIGNYIYPAMQEGIVRDFYWVVPGSDEDFDRALPRLKRFILGLQAQDAVLNASARHPALRSGPGILRTRLLSRKVTICTLSRLPRLPRPVLLDIDTDFMVNRDLAAVDCLDDIGRRVCAIQPQQLAKALRVKVPRPAMVTIAYSVTGGFTPAVYKHLGDEIACVFDPGRFSHRLRRARRAAEAFGVFRTRGRQCDYLRACRLDPVYKSAYNSYGLLWLRRRRFPAAAREFRAVLRVDPAHAASLVGLGCIAQAQGNSLAALRLFARVRRRHLPRHLQEQLLSGKAQAAYALGKDQLMVAALGALERVHPGHAETGYLLGRMHERRRRYRQAVHSYCRALRCGYVSRDVFLRLFRLFLRVPTRHDTIIFVTKRFFSFLDSEFSRGEIRGDRDQNL